MHLFPDSAIPEITPENIWTLKLDELEKFACALMGTPAERTWVRRHNETIIANRFRSVNWTKLEKTLLDMGAKAQTIIKSNDSESILRAAAYWHLRYENTHPLYDGNGRTGRVIMALQCETACRFSSAEILSTLQELDREYHWVFVPDNQSERFQLLLDILGRITGTILSEGAFQLPLPIESEIPIGNKKS